MDNQKTYTCTGVITVNVTARNRIHAETLAGEKLDLPDIYWTAKLDNSEMFEFLDNLRDSGAHNMMSIGARLEVEFDLDQREAKEIALDWMRKQLTN